MQFENGVFKARDSLQIHMEDVQQGNTEIYFSGTTVKNEQCIASYNLQTKQQSMNVTPTQAYLKGVANDTLLFTLNDSTGLYSYFSGAKLSKIMESRTKTLPTEFVVYGDRVYFRYDNGFYVSGGQKNNTHQVKEFKNGTTLSSIYASQDHLMLTIRFNGELLITTYLFEPKGQKFKYVTKSKTGFPTPINFGKDRFLFSGSEFFYINTTVQDSGIKQISNKSFGMFHTIDRSRQQYFFTINENVLDVEGPLNFYKVDSSFNFQVLNAEPIIYSKGERIGNSIFAHKGELYYELLTYDHLEIRRFTKDNSVGINSTLSSLNIYPNPVLDVLNIKSENVVNYINIYNSSGQLCLEFNGLENTITEIDLSYLSSGLYYLEAVSDGTVFTSKLLKE